MCAYFGFAEVNENILYHSQNVIARHSGDAHCHSGRLHGLDDACCCCCCSCCLRIWCCCINRRVSCSSCAAVLSAPSLRQPASSSATNGRVAAVSAAAVIAADAPTRPDTAAVSARSRTASALIRSGLTDRTPPAAAAADDADASPPRPKTADVFIADDDALSCDAKSCASALAKVLSY